MTIRPRIREWKKITGASGPNFRGIESAGIRTPENKLGRNLIEAVNLKKER